jgi:trehalose 6-phosphate synthase/phosphatase
MPEERGSSGRRTILVSNRLPVSIRVSRGILETIPSSGGLATGLRGPHSRGDSLWIGWPGDTKGLNDAATS